MASLPDLPQGDCWAWIGGDKPRPPTLVHVPQKNSLHPDRRVMRGDIATKPRNAVDVGKFVTGMKSTLVAVEEEDKASNPVLLRKRIVELEAAAKKTPAVDPAAIATAEKRGFEQAQRKAIVAAEAEVQKRTGEFLEGLRGHIDNLAGYLKENGKAFKAKPSLAIEFAAAPAPASPVVRAPAPPRPAAPRPPRGNGADTGISGSEQKIVDAIRWWNVLGVPSPTHAQVGFIAGYSHKSGTWATYLSRLRSAGMIEGRGDLVLTEAGLAIAHEPDTPPSGDQLRATVLSKVDGSLAKIMRPIIEAYPEGLSHADAGERAGYSPSSGTWATYLSRLRSLDLIEGRGELKAQGWLFP